MSVRVRFAPSNTGYLHLGGARTALFNYLFARHHDGDFLLRVEDTDQARSQEKYTEAILDAHEWLGMEPDEEVVFQSDRMELYREKAEELLESGDAYRDYSTEEEIEEARKEAFASGDKTVHTRLWRDRDDEPEDRDSVVRIKAPLEGELTVHDHVQGEVTVGAEELDDFVILRSDGTPTYNFCVVVDDAGMDITHVIRGKDHLNNTFRQLYVYEALGYEPPEFAHLPLIEGLSKRKGSRSVQAYRDEDGYLREGLNNYLARLGWAHGDQEIFSPDELVEYFELDGVSKSSGEFDVDKLEWVNAEWLKRLDAEEVAERWANYLREHGYEVEVDDRLVDITEEMRPRGRTFQEMTEESAYFFEDSIERNDDDVEEWLTADIAEMFEELVEGLDELDTWTNENIDDTIRDLCDRHGEGLGAIAQPVRVAVTGGTSSPGLFSTLAMLGRDRSIERLSEALEIIQSRAE
jgi:glutamyl-tRNA synthetase